MNKEYLKYKDKYCTKYVLQQIGLIKKYFRINPNKRIFAFNVWCRREYFLCDNQVFVARFDSKDKELIFSSLYRIILNDNDIIFETIISDNTTPKTTKWWDCIEVDCTNKLYTKEEFLIWLDSPCTTTEMVNVTNRQAIKFLQNYKKDTFKTENYIFYVKRDRDYTFLDNFYAFDIKNNAEMKLYFDSYIDTILPAKNKDILVIDLSKKLSKYQLEKCKKEFMIFMKKINSELKVENFYALEFVKQCTQPIEKDKGWGVARAFAGDFEFTTNIWIDDYRIYDQKPYFVMTKGHEEWQSTNACAIDFFKPEYKSKGPYINGYYKRNHWELDSETIDRLVKFLKAPYEPKNHIGYLIAQKSKTPDEIRQLNEELQNLETITNWQHLILEYNYNLSQDDEELPLDLQMPDYTLLNSKNN